jgi:hypothetical protein
LVLDHVVTDLRPIQNRAGIDVRRGIFDHLKDSLDSDAATTPSSDSELGNAHKLAKDNDAARSNVDIRNKRDRHALVNKRGPYGYDDWIAHGGSSLAQAYSNELVGCSGIGDNLPEINGACIDVRYDTVLGGVHFLAHRKDLGIGWVFRDVEHAFHGDRSEHTGLEVAFGDADQIALNHDRSDRHIDFGRKVDVPSVMDKLSLHNRLEARGLRLEEEERN